jgi:Flp pilus assembly pilin Flp
VIASRDDARRDDASRDGASRSGFVVASCCGQGVVEFGLILAIAALVAVVALVFFGPQLAAILDFIGAQVQQPA